MKYKIALVTAVLLPSAYLAFTTHKEKITRTVTNSSKNEVVQTPRRKQSNELAKVVNSTLPLHKEKNLVPFLHEINGVFNRVNRGGVAKKEAQEQVFKLNEEWESRKGDFLAELQRPVESKDLELRMSMIDYLKYRLKFDHSLRAVVVDLIVRPVPEQFESEQKAFALADKAELAGGLASVDWDEAQLAIRSLENSLLVDIALSESFYGLVAAGKTNEEALALCKSINPIFEI